MVLDSKGSQVKVHKATEGTVFVERGVPGAATLDVEGCAMRETDDVQEVLWGKLLLNLNNALNALSGLPLAEELSDRRWRALLAMQMDEALNVMDRAGIKPAKLAGVPPGFLPTILRLPDWLFRRIAGRMLAIDPHARSSTWDDLQKGRSTEIAEFQGEIAELALKHAIPAPLTDRIIELISEAERAGRGSPALTPDEVMR